MAYGRKTGGRKKGIPNKTCQTKRGFYKLLHELTGENIVYVIKAADRYKIGRTSNMSLRFKRVAGLSPYPLELVYYIISDDYYRIEKALHSIFKNKRIHYEWFILDDSDLEIIKTIKTFEDTKSIIVF